VFNADLSRQGVVNADDGGCCYIEVKRRVSSSCFDLVGWISEAQTVTSRFPHA
jgi:hypothetical protein